MLTSRPLQSPHCAMALKHVNQKAARCYWCQIVVTPLVPKQNAAGGPKVVTLTPLRSSAHRNAANGWCGSSLLLCLTHCIEVHDSYWIHGHILWQITEITKPEWTQLLIPSVYVLLNVTKWHTSHLDRLDNFVFMALCVQMAPSTPGSRRESPQKWKEWSTTSIILQKGAFLTSPHCVVVTTGIKPSSTSPLLLEDYLSCLKESLLKVSTLKSGTSGHLQSPTLGLQPYVLSSSILSQGPCFALKK